MGTVVNNDALLDKTESFGQQSCHIPGLGYPEAIQLQVFGTHYDVTPRFDDRLECLENAAHFLQKVRIAACAVELARVSTFHAATEVRQAGEHQVDGFHVRQCGFTVAVDQGGVLKAQIIESLARRVQTARFNFDTDTLPAFLAGRDQGGRKAGKGVQHPITGLGQLAYERPHLFYPAAVTGSKRVAAGEGVIQGMGVLVGVQVQPAIGHG